MICEIQKQVAETIVRTSIKASQFSYIDKVLLISWSGKSEAYRIL